MIRVVIDTNVVVSAALNDDSLPAAVLSLAIHKNILMFVSSPILAEYEKELSRPHLKLPSERVKSLLAEIHASAKVVLPHASSQKSRKMNRTTDSWNAPRLPTPTTS
jgi:putative PIN family toxin of toxin-antitoxin system